MGPHHSKGYNLVTLITERIENAGITYKDHSPKMHWLAILSSVCFAVTCILQIIALINAKDDIDRLFECFSVISFCGMGILKLISLYHNYKHWNLILNIVTMLERDQYSEESSALNYESDEDENTSIFTPHIVSYTKKFKTISTLLVRMYGSTAVVYIISPFAEHALLRNTVESNGWPHILPGWTPLDGFSFYGYIFTIVIETVAAVYCVCIHVAFDLAAVGIMIFICGQFCLLRDYSKNIGGKGKALLLSKWRDERAHRRIVRSHKIHMLLVE